jgi:Zn/Cd-binding protein ZinT
LPLLLVLIIEVNKNIFIDMRWNRNLNRVFMIKSDMKGIKKRLKNRREKYRTQNNKDLENIKVCKETFTLYFD